MKFRIIKFESGKRIHYEVASDKSEADELLKGHWNKQKKLSQNVTEIENDSFSYGKSKCFIEEIDLS